jgi:hypothetical protein
VMKWENKIEVGLAVMIGDARGGSGLCPLAWLRVGGVEPPGSVAECCL